MPDAEPNEPPDPPAPPRPPVPASFRERIELLTSGEQRAPGIVVAVVVVAVVAAVLLARGGSAPAPEITMPVAGGPGDIGTTTTPEPTVVFVHAAGAVVTPGVYQVPAGARVADVLEAAGGPAAGADLDRLNLAAVVSDGQQVYVPRVGEPAPVPAADAAGGPGGGASLVDLNTADRAQLQALPGVGPAIAAAIVEERERRGRFRSVEELLEVRGIGPAKLEQIRELVTV